MTKNRKTNNSLSPPRKPGTILEPEPLDYSYSRTELRNGLRIVEIHQPHLHTGTIAVYIRSGSRYESPMDNGLSHFLEHMVFRGTEKHRDTFELNLAVENIGGTLFAATSPDTTEYGLSLPPENMATGVGLLAELITEPIFSGIDIERGVITEEKKEDLDENGNDIDIDFLSRSRLWPECPLGQSVIGPVENIEGFTVDDLARYHGNRYVATNMVVCVSGAYDAQSVPATISDAFEAVPNGDAIDPRFNTLKLGSGPTLAHIPKPGSQTHVRIAFRGFGEDDDDRVALSVLMGILDDGMSTRLHRRIFEDLGLAYNIGADVESYSDTGALNVDASTSHDKVARIVGEVFSLVSDLNESLVTTQELEKARRREIWGLRSFLDDPHAMSSWYGEQELIRRPPLLEERIYRTQLVEREDLIRVANRIFAPGNAHVTSVGTQTSADLRAQEEALNLLCRN